MKQTFLLPWLIVFALPPAIFGQETTPQPVHTGIYLMNVYDIDVNAYTFYADFYLWFRWRGERDPMNIEFVNAVEKWGFTQEPFYEEPKELPDGSLYNGMRVEGRFYHAFDLQRFPLDRHQLDIRVENIDYTMDSLVYMRDTARHLFRSDLNIPGWSIDRATLATQMNFYQTSFGEPGAGSSAYSNFTFRLHVARPVSYFLLKLLLPLLVVLAAGLGALFIHPRYLDARISLPIGALLSVVFLQQSTGSALPDVGDMVLMDRIYLAAYLLIALTMLRVILAGNRLAGEKKSEADWSALQRTDRRRALVLGGVFVGVVLLLLVLPF